MSTAGTRWLLRDRVRDALIAAGTWVHREDLEHMTTCAPALDDALADLVIDGVAEHRDSAGYRLVGDPLARKALQRLQAAPDDNRVVILREQDQAVRIGIAERRPGIGLMSYVLALPAIEDDAKGLARLQGLADFWNTKGG